MSLTYTANTDFNGDGKFSECELDASWATLQVQKLLETSGSTSIEIGGTSFSVTDNETFLKAVKAMVALNVSASIASDGCAVVSSLPIDVTIPAPEYPLDNPIAYYRFNDYPTILETLGKKTPDTMKNSVTGNADTTISGGWQWTHPRPGDQATRKFITFGDVTLGGVDSRLGNVDWTIHATLTNKNSGAPGSIIKKATFRIQIYGSSLVLTAAGKTLIISKSYTNDFQNKESRFTIVNKSRESSGSDISLYLNGTKLGQLGIPGRVFTEGELNDPFIVTNKYGHIDEVLVVQKAVDESLAVKMGTRILPFIPRFYHALDLTNETAWQTDAQKISFNGTDLVIDGAKQTTNIWHDKTNVDSEGWSGTQDTRRGVRLGWGQKLEAPIDLSKDFTVSFWMYYESAPTVFLKITDDVDTSKELRIAGYSNGKDLWVSHTKGPLGKWNGAHKGAIAPDPAGSFRQGYWNHLTVVKNGGTIAFWLNGKYNKKAAGQFLSLNQSQTDNQTISTLTLKGTKKYVWFSDLFIMDSAITQPYVFSTANDYPEIENLMNENYFYE